MIEPIRLERWEDIVQADVEEKDGKVTWTGTYKDGSTVQVVQDIPEGYKWIHQYKQPVALVQNEHFKGLFDEIAPSQDKPDENKS